MYIALRTGGGRGVYEIAGATATGLTSTDLLGREIVFELTPDLHLPSGVVLGVQGGKHRLQIADAEMQIQRQFATALMLPSPRRVNNVASSGDLITEKQYVVERIHLDFTNHLLPDRALVVPGDIELKNRVGELAIQTQQRIAVLRSVWDNSHRLPETLRTLVRQHKALVTAGKPIDRECEGIVSMIRREANQEWPEEVKEAGDPLPALAKYLDLHLELEDTVIEEAQGEDFDLKSIVGMPRRVRRAIIQRRGQRSFRRGLLAAYGSRCQVTQYTGEPALEAAHIYPYSEGGEYTNDLRNGLLLRADIHVLFDLGLLKVTPGNLTVRIMQPLAGSSYTALDGTVIRVSSNLRPSVEALEKKWALSPS